jgi:hypothetical protein
MANPTREEIEAQIAAAEARGDTKIARLEGKIDSLAATIGGRFDALSAEMRITREENNRELGRVRSESRETRWVLATIIIGAAFAVVAIVVGLATYGDALFGRGMGVRDVVQSMIKSQAPAAISSPATTPPPTAPTKSN